MHALALTLLAALAQPLAPERIPAWRQPADYAGAQACSRCHADVFAQWRASPHGRAMAEPSEATVRGRFDGAEVPLHEGRGRALRTPDGGYAFELPNHEGRGEIHPVALTLASGRTHQLYVTQTDDGRYRPFPVYWASGPGRWASLQAYRPSSLDFRSPDWWGRGSLLRYACLDCHASQASYVRTPTGIRTEWVDLSINCEACHGPAKEHAAQPTGPNAVRPLRLQDLSKEREAAVCGQCHAYKIPFDFGVDDRGIRQYAPHTPTYEGFRPDGTQRQTVYQGAAHLLSECHRQGSLTCSACHDPHSGRPRDLAGRSAEGPHAHRQCTACHRDLAPGTNARHTGHPPGAADCVGCHMGRSWVLDSPSTHQWTSDHSMAIPRPDEATRFGTSLSCLHCHADRDPGWARDALRDWGSTQALTPRPWVEAVAFGRLGDPQALPRLQALLADPNAGHPIRAAALSAVEALPTDADAVRALLPWVDRGEPILRGYALRALMQHDPKRAEAWRRRGAADPHAFVRLAAFGGWRDLRTLPTEELRQAAEDAAQRALSPSEPISVWATAARAHLRRGEPEAARPYLDAADAWASPEQRRFHDLERLRWLMEGAQP